MEKKKINRAINKFCSNLHNKTPRQINKLIKDLSQLESQLYHKLKLIKAFHKLRTELLEKQNGTRKNKRIVGHNTK